MREISSREHPLIKSAAALIRDKKHRLEQGLFVCEGLKMLEEALISGAQIQTVLTVEEYQESCLALTEQAESPAEMVLISRSAAQKISDVKTPQGIFAIIKMLDKVSWADTIKGIDTLEKSLRASTMPSSLHLSIKKDGVFLALEDVRDPGNVGTIIRTADAFGMEGVFLSPECADVYNSKTLRSTMGAVFRVPILQDVDLREVVMSGAAVCYATVLDAGALSPQEIEVLSGSSVILFFGNESKGLSQELIRACAKTVTIPMQGNAESLNVAVAAGIISYAVTEKRK